MYSGHTPPRGKSVSLHVPTIPTKSEIRNCCPFLRMAHFIFISFSPEVSYLSVSECETAIDGTEKWSFDGISQIGDEEDYLYS